MGAKTATLIGAWVFLLTGLAVATAQTYQPDDPVPPGSVFTIVDLESRIIDLQFRVEAAPPDGKGARPGVASGPHSTMSSDFLYLPANPDAVATLTIRVADRQGQPLQGKRVQVRSAVSGGPADTIIQPEAPTDARGVTTARVKPTTPPHTARFSARVLEDNVDIGQVVEIVVLEPRPPSLLPAAFAPYFSKNLVVSPTPLVVGRPTTVAVSLTNRRTVPVEVRARFFASVLNIGLGHWPQIGETGALRLNPGESRDAKITWTPTVESGKLCFRADVLVRELPKTAAMPRWSLFPAGLEWTGSAQAAEAQTGEAKESIQRNIGPVIPGCEDPSKPGPLQDYTIISGGVKQRVCEITSKDIRKDFCRIMGARFRAKERDTEGDWFVLIVEHADRCINIERRDFTPQGFCDNLGDAIMDALKNKKHYAGLAERYEKCAADPPDPEYRKLVAAESDTPAGYMDAATRSLERYRAAQAQNDQEWATRHYSAIRLYFGRHAQALRRYAEALEKEAQARPPDDPDFVAKVRAARDRLWDRQRRGEEFTQEERKRLQEAGISEKDAKAAMARLLASEPPPVKSPRALLLEHAALYRRAADEAEKAAAALPVQGEPGKLSEPFVQSYLVGNPHDREETIDLFIRRASVPPEWKLLIVDAEPAADGKRQNRLQEVEAGRHYRVRLPAQGRLTVASVAIPVGVVGENLTVRWADEGKIGEELIGGIVHEMHVPGFLPDLKLPPITPTATPGAGDGRLRGTLFWALAAASLLLLGLVLIAFWRRSRRGV